MGKKRKLTKKIFPEFVEWLATPEDERLPQMTVAEQWGVSDRTIRNWMRDPEVGEAATDLAMSWVGAQVPQVVSSMVREAKRGNVAAAKLILELLNMLRQIGSDENPLTIRFAWQDMGEDADS